MSFECENMIRFYSVARTAIVLVCLCSCAAGPREPTTVTAAPNLPAEVEIKKIKSPVFAAPFVTVTLHLENGIEFKCCVDTGTSGTILPNFLEPQLGKRISKGKLWTADEVIHKANIYAAPRIYLGDTPLMTGDRVSTWNEHEGILGMDCLRHYCVQFDFQNGKMRFLKSGDTNTAKLGKAFPLTSLRYAYLRQDGFFEQKDLLLLVDTGDPIDGMMDPKSLERAVQEKKAQPVPFRVVGDYTGKIPKLVSLSTCSWGGEIYTNLLVEAGRPSIIGLKFLARHQVTFDFPKKVMYLKYRGENSAPTNASP